MLKVLTFVIGCALASTALAQLMPPTPSAADGGQRSQTHPDHTNPKAAAEKQAPAQRPFAIAPDLTERGKPRADTQPAEADEKSTYDWGFLIIQTLATVVVAAFTVRLWISTNNLWKETKATAATAKESAEAARRAAAATEESVATARQQFIAAHRPRVIFRSAYFDHSADGCADIKVRCQFVNVGDTVAVVKEIFAVGAQTSSRRDLPTPLFNPVGEQCTFILQSGDSIDHEAPSRLSAADFESLRHPQSRAFYLIGKISYFDKNGRNRATGFCRWYDPARAGFTRPDGSVEQGYEYED